MSTVKLFQSPGVLSDNAKCATPPAFEEIELSGVVPIVQVKEQTVGTVPSSPASSASRRVVNLPGIIARRHDGDTLQVDGWRGRVVNLTARSIPNAELSHVSRSNYFLSVAANQGLSRSNLIQGGAMSIKPFLKLFKNDQLSALMSINALFKPFYKLSYLAAAKNNGLLDLLSGQPLTFEKLAETYCKYLKACEALEAWLQLGIRLGFLKLSTRGYTLTGLAT